MSEHEVKQVQQMFNEVKPVRGFEDIALQIQQAILDGQLKTGDRLPNERELGAVFGVSRPTLREAIRSLEAAGVVEVRRGANGGTFIGEPKADQVGQALAALIRFRGVTVDELAEFRSNFESETAFWAAKRATPDQIRKLQEIARRFQVVAENPDSSWAVIVEHDLAFHEEVAHTSQNQIRVAIMMAIHDVLHRTALMIADWDTASWRGQQIQEVKNIVDAIANHDVRRAKRLMRQHVSTNIEAVVRKKEDTAENTQE